MRSDIALDYAVFQLSPKRSRCELFVSGDGKTEKLASGLLKPFVTHLTVAEEQVAQKIPSIKLEVNKRKNDGNWFTKGTLERFVRFVSTPEVLELVNKIDAEMSQLEAARKIYLQGAGNQNSSPTGGERIGASTSADITKKELLRAIDVRLVAVQQDLTTACARASAAGFTVDTVSELQLFADQFGAHRLNEACTKFMLLSQNRPDLVIPWNFRGDNLAIGSSFDSDMSLDDSTEENVFIRANDPLQPQPQLQNQHHPRTEQQISQEPANKRDEQRETNGASEKKDEEALSESPQMSRPSRRLSVQDRINMFENKQKEQGPNSGGKVVIGKSLELRRLSSDVSGQAAEKAVLRRWSGASDMSMDFSGEKKDTESSASTPCSTSNSVNQASMYPSSSMVKEDKVLNDTAMSSMSKFKGLSDSGEDPQLKDQFDYQTNLEGFSGKVGVDGLRMPINSGIQSRTSFGKSEDVGSKNITNSETESRTSFDSSEGVGWKDEPSSQIQFKGSSIQLEDNQWRSQVPAEDYIQLKTSIERTKDLGLIDQTASQSQPLRRTSSVGTGSVIAKSHISSLATSRASLAQAEIVGSNVQTAAEVRSKVSLSKVDDFGSANESSQLPPNAHPGRVDNSRFRHQPANLAQLRASLSTVADVGVNSKDTPALPRQSRDSTRNLVDESRMKDQTAYQGERGSRGDALAPQSVWGSLPGNSVDTTKKDPVFSQMQVGGITSRVEGSNRQEMKLQRQSSASEKTLNLSSRRSETTSIHVNGDPLVFHGKFTAAPEMSDCVSTAAVEQVQKARQSKGNQELNDELQIKANDLEKLFAAHKLRVPGDQSATVKRGKPAEVQVEQAINAMYRKPMEVTPLQFSKKVPGSEPLLSANSALEYDANLQTRIDDNQDQGDIGEVSYSEDARGKLYDMYVRKRDAKLKEEWSSNRGQKEAKMKAMQEYLESSSAEMKAKFSGSADRQDSVLNARRRAEKLRSFNIRSAMKVKEQHPIGFLRNEDDEDVRDISEQNKYGQERLFGEAVPGDGSSRSSLSKRLLTNRTTFSSTPRTSATLFSRSSVKTSSSIAERRRTQTENPLAQSVPNFSDLRKENTKPSTGISKAPTRSQPRSARSKSISEELSLGKEDKPRRSQSMKKTSTGSGEIKDTLSLNSDEQTEPSLYNKVLKNGETKPFLRKGNGMRASSGAGIAKLKASMASENLKAEEEADGLEDQFEDSVDIIQGEEEELEGVMGDELKVVEYPADSDNEKPGISKESVKSDDLELENGKLFRSLAPVGPDSVDEVAAVMPSMFHSSLVPMQDSPGESPASWNSRGHHPFSYAQEMSDTDAFVESPMGSPASWNSHSLNQIEADAARMRKKWGSAQKTVLVSNTSSHQTRKDVTKGFKRLLKFGRKSRGTESLVDWISATTSEGDDDTEDGFDLANRSSEDLRKSRMGFSQDGFNDGDLFNEQVQALRTSIPTPPANFKLREEHLSGSSLKAPRSFFSLSSFRSKGSESKPR